MSILNAVSLTALTPDGKVTVIAPLILHTTTLVTLTQLKITSLSGNSTASDGVITGPSIEVVQRNKIH